ncbi:MAG: hypothetical protein II127_02765, partial [Ruminococcus sp.]|nr:hypothetical protein [Ruminococcus sp.]
ARLAFSYSVSLPKKSRQGDSLTSIYLYNLTKNLTAQSAHLNYAVLPKDIFYIQADGNKGRFTGGRKSLPYTDNT